MRLIILVGFDKKLYSDLDHHVDCNIEKWLLYNDDILHDDTKLAMNINEKINWIPISESKFKTVS